VIQLAETFGMSYTKYAVIRLLTFHIFLAFFED